MKRSYKLEGLDCAGCALNIGEAAGKIPSVSNAHVDFTSQRLDITSQEALDDKTIEEIVHQFEPDIVVTPWKYQTASEVEKEVKEAKVAFRKEWITIAIALALMVLGVVFKKSSPLFSTLLLVVAYGVSGFDIGKTAVQRIFQKKPLDETLLMTIATLGAWVLGEGVEAVAVMVFYRIGETLQNMAVHRGRADIRTLSSLISEKAHLIKEGSIQNIDTKSIQINDILEIRTGERIPVDGTVVFGEALLNTAALTGEPLPQNFSIGEEVLSGSLNSGPLFHLKASQILEESTVARILKMTQEEQARKAAPERFLSKFAYYYTPSVVALAFLVFLLPPLLGLGSFSMWAYKALLLLVISCPCALVLSVPLSYVAGMGKSAKEGFLVKGGTVLEELATVDTIAFDKTGTLTKGAFKVKNFVPYQDTSLEELLFATFLAESKSTHPLAKSIMSSPQGEKWLKEKGHNLTFDHYEEIPGKGVSLTFEEKDILCGNRSLMELHHIQVPSNAQKAQIHTSINRKYVGSTYLTDTLREKTQEVLETLHNQGIKEFHVLTGDSAQGSEILSSLPYITQVHSSLLPEDKANIITNLQNKGHQVAFIGDGINDAPVLAAAQVGIAIGGVDSQAAAESADALLAKGNLTALPKGRTIAKRTARIVRINVTLALVVKLAAMVLGILGYANMLIALFADVGVSLLCVLLAGSIRLRKV